MKSVMLALVLFLSMFTQVNAQSISQNIFDGGFTEDMNICTVFPTGTVVVNASLLNDSSPVTLYISQQSPTRQAIPYQLQITNASHETQFTTTDGLYCFTTDSSNRNVAFFYMTVRWTGEQSQQTPSRALPRS